MNTVGVTAANDELAGGRSGRQRMSAPDLDLALLGDRREPTHAYLAAHTGLGARNVAITRPSGAPGQRARATTFASRSLQITFCRSVRDEAPVRTVLVPRRCAVEEGSGTQRENRMAPSASDAQGHWTADGAAARRT
ncbi:hypothetical protein AcV7_008753 [Taiwanofungus camphoratus]|nr:hypothetical protein AcV7_008753 [Antrodia cinnamomea]